MNTEPVTFHADGLALAGSLYLPHDLDGPAPGLAFCHGFGATMEYVAPEIARALAGRGYAVLIFDHRGFGDSEGDRWRLLPQEQVRDIRSALVYLAQRPDLDRSRLGLFGISFGGAHAIEVAAMEPLARCSVSCVPFADGRAWMRDIRRYWEWVEFLDELEEDRVQTVVTGRSRMVDPDHILVRDPESIEWNEELKAKFPSRHTYQLPLETGRAIIEYRPVDVVDRVARLLIIAVERDTLIPFEQVRALYDRARDPKRLHVVRGATHHDIYRPSHFDAVIDAADAWYRRHLAGPVGERSG